MNKERNKNYDILIVDDEPLIRESLYEILRIDGFHAHMASSGEDALDVLNEQKVDIVVTDMKLPKMSGLQLIDKISHSQKPVFS